MSKETNPSSFINGLFWGGIVGSSLGLFLAPEKGQKIRNKIQKVLEEHKEDYDNIKNELKDLSADLIKLVKNNWGDKLDFLEDLYPEKKKPLKKKRSSKKKSNKRRKK